MKRINSTLAAAIFLLASCKSRPSAIVDRVFADSLMAHYTAPAAVKINEAEIAFWKNRINPNNPGISSESRYAAALIARFHLGGAMDDILAADSTMKRVNAAYNYKEAGPNTALAGYAVLQHRFTEADRYINAARQLGLKKEEALTASFDVDFELGRYSNAALYVKQLQPYADYSYYFRRSKLDHLQGNMDSAIHAMLMAAGKAESSVYLKHVALANAADLYIHAGELQQAYNLYKTCIAANSADLHSITGLGWIALVHDKNDSLAQQLFDFVSSKTQLPDPVFKLYQVAQQRGDTAATLRYAQQFADRAADSLYGNMYNKYLIELYTGILQQPAKAAAIAARELSNRNTPQTNAWYAWSLFANGQQEAAWKVYQQSVSGKPLEALELYWMGKLMQGLGKGYNANAFFKAARNNKYDLSPAMLADLEKNG